MAKGRTGESPATIGEVVVAACTNDVPDSVCWKRAEVQLLVYKYVADCSSAQRRAIVDAGFRLRESPVDVLEDADGADGAAAKPAVAHKPVRRGAIFRGPGGKERLEQRLRELAGPGRWLYILAPTDDVLARKARTPVLTTFFCMFCRIRHTVVLSTLDDPTVNGSQFRCLCTAMPGDRGVVAGKGFGFRDAYSNHLETFYSNVRSYIECIYNDAEVATDFDAFEGCRASVVLRCTACCSERRVITAEVFHNNPNQHQCPCLITTTARLNRGTS